MYNKTITQENLKSINNQSPATTNQIKSEKPSIIKNSNVLEGYIANSINGGHVKPIAYYYVMAGSKIMDYRLRMNLKMLTPKNPAYQKLKAVFKAYFVPHSRVWENWEKFLAQKGGNTVQKISTIPNIGTTFTSFIETESNIWKSITNTDKWRDSWFATYIPRYQQSVMTNDLHDNVYDVFPSASTLPIRGFKAIYNDFERNKEYDTPFYEYKGDDGSQDLAPLLDSLKNYVEDEEYLTYVRGRRQNSYYTNYRTELLGEIENPPTKDNDYLVTLQEWEKKLSEYRSRSENSQKTDWSIISEIRGSKPLTEGKVQLLGTREVGLNYISVPQTTYNTNSEIAQEYQSLGTEGAYSFTEIDLSMFKMQEFKEEGYIHIVMQITADSVFETGFERTSLNVNVEDIPRPDLVDLKNDILLDIEKGTNDLTTYDEQIKATGYKRKYTEYFKAPNAINGDIMSAPFYQTTENNGKIVIEKDNSNNPILIENQRAYQFFETSEKFTDDLLEKMIWKDYTDILINENQAYTQEVRGRRTQQGKNDIQIKGQNQLFFIGMHQIIVDLPLNENVKANFTKWGEV